MNMVATGSKSGEEPDVAPNKAEIHALSRFPEGVDIIARPPGPRRPKRGQGADEDRVIGPEV